MKIFKWALITATIIVSFFSCQKELSFESGKASVGALVQDATGNCLPVTINGVYKAGTSLTDSNFVTVQISVAVPGTYNIQSNTVNGYSFSGKGTATAVGVTTVKLLGNGKPLAVGVNTFAVTYDSSVCSFIIIVLPSTATPALFTLGGAPGACTGATLGGTYTAGTALTVSNTLTVQVNVTTAGYYSLSATTTNGFNFSVSGVFTSTGTKNLTLNGSGTPTTAGNTTVTVTNAGTSCTFPVTVLSGTGGGGTTASQFYFQFNDGATLIAADTSTVVAMEIPNSGFVLLSVDAFSITGDTAFSISVSTNGNPQVNVNYKTSTIGVPLSTFECVSTTNGTVYMADFSTPSQNININFSTIDVTNKIVSGTFSGTAKGLTSVRPITNGKFRAQLQ